MSHQEPGAARGWLPTLDADRRLRSRFKTDEFDHEPEVDDPPAERVASPDWAEALESQFGLRSTDHRAVRRQETPSAEQEHIASLQERLAYYENFDVLIKDNIARSAELFQEVFTERAKARAAQEDAESLINAVSAEAERRLSAERQHMQRILTALMDEARFLQQRSDSLVQRVAEAITEMTAFHDEDDAPVSGA